MTITMTLDELKHQKALSAKRFSEILAFNDTDISDCPELSDEELAQCKPKYPQKQGHSFYKTSHNWKNKRRFALNKT